MVSETLSYPDSDIIDSYGDDIVVSAQRLKQGYWLSDSTLLLDNIGPSQERLHSGFHSPSTTKPAHVSYNLPARTRVWVDTPHHHFLFTNPKNGQQKAFCWAAIMHQTELREMETNRDVVPIEVATLGTAYIAAYMFAVHGYSYSEIIEELGITKETLYQYLSDVRQLRR